MKKKFLHDISANSLQLIINQACGLAIFYILSTRLPKGNFGEINWTLGVLLTGFGILSFGIDQIFIKRIASGREPGALLPAYLFHVLFSGLAVYALAFLASLLFPQFFSSHNLLLWLGIAKLMIFFSTPFKQLATGLERFRALLLMSVCSNLVRTLALLLLLTRKEYEMQYVIAIFILGDFAELLLSILITRTGLHIPIRFSFRPAVYKDLLKESLPQLGVTVMAAILARFDWIYLGVAANSYVVADYSFAYKIFEIATLPMMVVAPVLITRFARLFHPDKGTAAPPNSKDLFLLLRFEMLVAAFTALVLVIGWTPVIDWLTDGKYGAINQYTILLLAAAIPFMYFNNFLWTINFSRGKLKDIFYVFLLTLFVNITADMLLVPDFEGEGAAAGFFIAMAVQSLAYNNITELDGLQKEVYALPASLLCAFAAGLTAFLVSPSTAIQFCIAIPLFLLFTGIAKQYRKSDLQVLKRFIGLNGNPSA